jgi:dolichol-phosphate mannosyltransferase
MMQNPFPESLLNKARLLKGEHIMITGAHGFIGSQLLNLLSLANVSCLGLSSGKKTSNVRVNTFGRKNLVVCDLDRPDSVASAFQRVSMVVHTATYGAYSWQVESGEIFRQVPQLENLLSEAKKNNIKAFVHLGSSSEYGTQCDHAVESQISGPNSLYSLAKIQCHNLISYYGKSFALPALTLRLFSIYGPSEHPRKLIPHICRSVLNSQELTLSDPKTARDFVHIFDALDIILTSLLGMSTKDHGEAYNVCTGVQTSLANIADALKLECGFNKINWSPSVAKAWDLSTWVGSGEKTYARFGWRPQIAFIEGLKQTLDFYRENAYLLKNDLFLPRKKISVIAPCFMDLQSIPVLFERLRLVFENLNYDFEFIVIDDLSPDGAYEALKSHALQDSRWVLAKHTRNFGSQSIFMHGLDIATGDAVVLMDGDLQDPPELIPQFIEKWEQGYDLCLGQRVSREEGLWFSIKCKAFYRLWNFISRIEIPLDSGDFGLISAPAAKQIVSFRTKVKLWRTLRAYPAYKTAMVPYRRPNRAFGHSTNSNRKLILWSLRFLFSTPNFIAVFYLVLGILGLAISEANPYFWYAWVVIGMTILIALANLIYLTYFNYPEYTTEELIHRQILVRFPAGEHDHNQG